MLKWLKRRLRKWLLDGESSKAEAPSNTLEILLHGKIEKVVILGPSGAMGLLCLVPQARGPAGEYVVYASQACDEQAFWKLWHKYNPKSNLTWDDGSPYGV